LLVEMAVVMAIIALLALAALPGVRPNIGRSEVEAEAVRLAALMRETRYAAMRGNAAADFSLDPATGAILAAGLPRTPVRRGIAIDWTTSSLCPTLEGVRALRFIADGRSCGAVATLTANGHLARLRVDWLTGRVELGRI
jgi:general secretion pathway protein H